MQDKIPGRPYILGIDLGVRSLGWAAIDLHGKEPCGIRLAGVRCFEAGVEGDVEKGKDQSRAAARRGPRQARRQTWRRAARRRKVLRVLQKHGLLPQAELHTPQQIHDLIANIDSELKKKHLKAGDKLGHHTMLYRLRAKALDEPFDLHELGRVLYHLAQRRGFESNRKTQKKDEDEGQVREAIGQLAAKMGSQTLGQYLSTLDPAEQRIRQRWTSRQMYRDEFERVWTAQSRSHKSLTDAAKKELIHAIFHQRPLKSQTHLIGRCSLIPGRRRAPLACRSAQRFRLLAAVNNLAFRIPGESDQPLDQQQRVLLAATLDRDGDLTFAKVRKLLGVKSKFNLEEGGETKIPGNRTDSKLAQVFGGKWDGMDDATRDHIVDEVLSYERDVPLTDHAMRVWGLSRERAQELSEIRLEQDRARFSRETLRRLLPHMEKGLTYPEARKEEFPESFQTSIAHDLLPPALEALNDLRNPSVTRALTELRKVINAAIRKWGKPAIVRVELARDLKNPRQKRKEAWEKNRANQKAREDAKVRILKELPGIGAPKASDIEKLLLADECNWTCPFTGRGISMSSLLGRNPEFDVEHILPFSKTLDNTYPNKTLCHVDENRHRKRNRTPFEAYGGTPQFDEIISRVKAFKGNMARAKLSRFKLEKLEDDFTDAQLQDTRYASRLAGEYLALLYGGRSDEDGTLRVQVSPGGATAFLRNEWQLNSILGDGGQKTRTNHKHHAVDAIAIALTSPAMVKRLCDAAERRYEAKRRLFAPIPDPWKAFLDGVRNAVGEINVSHRVNHKLSGALHEETNYGKALPHHDSKGKPIEVRHVRKPVTSLSATEIESIVEGNIRAHVKKKLHDVGGDAKKLENNWPTLPTKDGRAIPIRKVRIRKVIKVTPVGSPNSLRYVAPGANHHTVIVARKDKKGRVKWEDHPVTLLEAVQRKKAGQPVVRREWEDGEFVMMLSPGDSIRMKDDRDAENLFVVKSVSEGNYELRLHDDARTTMDIRKAGRAGGRLAVTPDLLRQRGANKVKVSPLGKIDPTADE